MKLVDIADLDCIYLTYDEPNAEENWVKIKNMVPWARRVAGVKGSDAAHKAAADASGTDRFILIDGDNLPDDKFFNLTLEVDEVCVYRWRARNHINGLMYGNGGLSCWTREFVRNMRTHENTDGTAENDVEFCFYPNYITMHDCYSTTYPNGSPFQAWRAGFREGVKMCLNKGAKPGLTEFKNRKVLHLAIAPEGTRQPTTKWKGGFHVIARAANVPVYFAVFDWGRREIGIIEKFELTDDVHADIYRIKQWYKKRGVKGKHPEKFILGEGLD